VFVPGDDALNWWAKRRRCPSYPFRRQAWPCGRGGSRDPL